MIRLLRSVAYSRGTSTQEAIREQKMYLLRNRIDRYLAVLQWPRPCLSASTSKDPLFPVIHVPPSTATSTSVSQYSDVLEVNCPLRKQSALTCPAPRQIIVLFLMTLRAIQHVSSLCASRMDTKKELSFTSAGAAQPIVGRSEAAEKGHRIAGPDKIRAPARTCGYFPLTMVQKSATTPRML